MRCGDRKKCHHQEGRGAFRWGSLLITPHRRVPLEYTKLPFLLPFMIEPTLPLQTHLNFSFDTRRKIFDQEEWFLHFKHRMRGTFPGWYSGYILQEKPRGVSCSPSVAWSECAHTFLRFNTLVVRESPHENDSLAWPGFGCGQIMSWHHEFFTQVQFWIWILNWPKFWIQSVLGWSENREPKREPRKYPLQKTHWDSPPIPVLMPNAILPNQWP